MLLKMLRLLCSKTNDWMLLQTLKKKGNVLRLLQKLRLLRRK
jgi:hypothetical protein